MNPPADHFTRSRGVVPPSPGEPSEHLDFGRPGRLVPKWIDDFVSGRLRDESPSVFEVGCAHPSVELRPVRRGVSQSRHELLVKGHQSVNNIPWQDATGAGSRDIVSCFCANCRYHFTIAIRNAGNAQCGSNNYQDIFHHLVFAGSTMVTPSDTPKYYPVLGQMMYACSARVCGTSVTVQVSEPRLDSTHLRFLQDAKGLEQRYKKAVENEPERFADVKLPGQTPLALLWHYVRDVAEGTPPEKKPDGTETQRRIDKRNKKFVIHFGDSPESVELLRYLDFEEIVVRDSEMWKLPTPEICRPTQIGTQLAFLQDVKSEIDAIISNDVDLTPNPAMSHLKKALHLDEHIATTKVTGQNYDPRDYDALGITPELHESIFWYAFGCQRQSDPPNEPRYFTALQNLTRGRGDEELEIKVQSYDSMRTAPPPPPDEDAEIRMATEMSLRDAQGKPNADLGSAYAYFNFNEAPETDEVLIGRFRAMCDASPAQRSTHREKLLAISRAMGNKRLADCATESMDLDEAVKYLGVERDTDPEFVSETAQWLAESGEKDFSLVANALLVMGKSRADSSLLLNTGALIKAEREQSYGVSRDDRMDLDGFQSQTVVNTNLPAGLENIRNTCYLNSILQYLFTVRQMRDIVLNWDKYGLENTEENLMARRIDPGSTRVERGEAFAGQQFAMQLRNLFVDLETTDKAAAKPTQSLALAALKNPKQLEDDGAKILARPATQAQQQASLEKDLPPPPPLPARPSRAPPVPPRRASEPKVTVSAVPETDPAETSSTVSSQTLVNQIEDGSDQSYVNVTSRDGRVATPPEPDMPQSKRAPGKRSSLSDMHVDDFVDTSALPTEGQGESGDAVMLDANTSPAETATVEQKIARALNDSSVTGTDQQDVEEVMGNIISHLRAAIKATGEDPEINVQTDPVMDMFFWTSASYFRKRGEREFRRTLNPNRWVTAFPDEDGATIPLLQALDRNFQRELIKENEATYERFSSIVKLPPILHIHIQRTTRGGGKNSTPIEIPEVLYLDRFMDAGMSSALFKKRQRSWDLYERLRSLNGPDGEVKEPGPDDAEPSTVRAYDDWVVDDFLKQDGSVDDEDDGFTIIDDSIKALLAANGVPLPAPLSGPDQDMGVTQQTIRDALHPEEARKLSEASGGYSEESHRKELDGLFSDMRKQKYRLHAVICHAGQTGRSGHYWVWIYDFEKGVWRKYNDSVVTEQPSTQLVMETLSTRGEPYYLAYVKDEDVAKMVEIPTRRLSEAGPEGTSTG